MDKLGLPKDATTYRFVATDDFYLKCNAEEMKTAELRVGLMVPSMAHCPLKKAARLMMFSILKL